jgi:nucleotide-binding universal stress UspA family protein
MTPTFSTILVPTDFSAGSRLALDYAIKLADRLGASVHLVHVLEDPAVTALWTQAYVDLDALRKERRCGARQAMNALLQQIAPARVTDEITSGPVAQTIASVAADHGADFIVMGTHGRTGLAHVLVGSVAEQVMRTAGCPVLTVRQGLGAAMNPAPVGAVGLPLGA